MNNTILVVALVVVAWLVLKLLSRGDIRGPQARELVAGGARLVDVRTPAEYAAGHLPGAINVPLDSLERRLEELGPPDRPIVLYCASGARSAHAKRVLARHGFAAVRNLGSIRAW